MLCIWHYINELQLQLQVELIHVIASYSIFIDFFQDHSIIQQAIDVIDGKKSSIDISLEINNYQRAFGAMLSNVISLLVLCKAYIQSVVVVANDSDVYHVTQETQ